MIDENGVEYFELPCGCRSELVGERYITILCEEHEYNDMVEEFYKPTHIKKTKMRETREI